MVAHKVELKNQQILFHYKDSVNNHRDDSLKCRHISNIYRSKAFVIKFNYNQDKSYVSHQFSTVNKFTEFKQKHKKNVQKIKTFFNISK